MLGVEKKDNKLSYLGNFLKKCTKMQNNRQKGKVMAECANAKEKSRV